MVATLMKVERISPHIKTFWFKPERRLEFVAGQYTQLHLPHPDTDNRGDKRWFTISSSPTDDLFSITCRFASERNSSFKKHLAMLTPGAQVHFADPMGDFVLPKDKSIPLVFAAGGIGITPMISMLSYMHATGDTRAVQLLYSARTSEELAFLAQIKAYGIPFKVIVSQPSLDWSGEIGHLDAKRILKAIGDSQDALIYVAGPEPFVETFSAQLQQYGVPSRRIVTDFFLGYPEV